MTFDLVSWLESQTMALSVMRGRMRASVWLYRHGCINGDKLCSLLEDTERELTQNLLKAEDSATVASAK